MIYKVESTSAEMDGNILYKEPNINEDVFTVREVVTNFLRVFAKQHYRLAPAIKIGDRVKVEDIDSTVVKIGEKSITLANGTMIVDLKHLTIIEKPVYMVGDYVVTNHPAWRKIWGVLLRVTQFKDDYYGLRNAETGNLLNDDIHMKFVLRAKPVMINNLVVREYLRNMLDKEPCECT